MRVGGRLSNSALNFETKHPILLHGDAYPVKLLIKQIHVRLGHLGLETVLGEVKRKFHILKGNKVIKDTIKSCVICRKVQGKVNSQNMAELPSDRVKGDDPPFFHSGTNLFGPFFCYQRKSKQTRKALRCHIYVPLLKGRSPGDHTWLRHR